ncbi:sensor histidine kinase [Croceitalea sp. MTPC5]|nr:sensor histidine kinase [Croceitalea sp. MTPC5]
MKKSLKIKEFWIHIIAWVCIATFPLFVSISLFQEYEPGMFLRISFPPLLFYMNYSLLVPKLLLKKKMVAYVGASILFLVFFILLVNQVNFFFPVRGFGEIQNLLGEDQLRPIQYFSATFISLAFFLLGGLMKLIKDFYNRDKAQKEIEVQRAETELEFLKAQLNPHFLFNSLNSVYSLVRNQSKEAPEAVITLSELMRYMLYEANQNKVSLEKEIEYIKNYVCLQRLRISDSQNVKLLIKGDYSDKMIAPLLLITFIENAFKYGTDFKGKTKVEIKIEINGDHLYFRTCNLIGLQRKDEPNSGIGLKNVENRLDYLYPKAHALDVQEFNGEYIVDLHITLV